MKRFICLPLLLVCVSVFSQQKTLQAIKIIQSPKIDGNLEEDVWANATVLTDFVQNFPTYGLPVSRKTEVKILYDNTSIYVGAYLYDDPSLIRKQITARDGESQTDVDYFSVFFDTYNDDQNGFQFLVTTANVQTDARLGPNLGGDFNSFGDKTWDAVWESKVSMKADGWVVEMRIPYSSLRFAKKDLQSWGIQLLRFFRRNNESSYWSPVDPKVNGFVNQFGELKDLKDIQPPLRLSFSPYVTTGYRHSPQTNGYFNEWLRNGGMDVKWGLNESFTVDATLVPDFGQVVSDNVVNNLTPYEVRFTENRPFFTEGTEIFNKANLFYSRRVGATPSGYRSVNSFVANNKEWEIVKNPSVTQLYNATKFSGRTQKKLGIGIFNALTAPMDARIHNTVSGKDSSIRTEPLANYNIIVLDQAFKGRSFITFTNTNVMRNGNGRDANVTALDVALYNKKNSHVFRGTARYSKIWGVSPYDGYNTTLNFGKVSGNWQYNFSGNVESKNYDPNDLGILFAPNEVTYNANLSYRQFKPTKNFITYSYSLAPRLQYLYSPYAYSRFDISGSAFWVFNNFWDISINANVLPGWERNYFELRTDGRYIKYPNNLGFEIEGSTDSRRKLFIRFNGVYAVAPKFDNVYTHVGLGMRYRFSNKFSLDLQTNSSYETNQLGYAFLRETNGEPIVGFRNNREFTSVLSGIYNFTSRLNLTLRARHYWNKVNYISFHNVDVNGDLLARPFIPGQDENVNIFNLDAFLTWDFRLGSRFIIGYKNWLGDEEIVNLSGKNTYMRNLGEVFDLRHGNEITIRFIYFLDYNQLRKKR
ncbi:MAG: carbohydrate binding family 9 domain-containing protein [Chitinophagaceae bacterium]|nr:carbohydrate binding family 9 domain-containing protein [Chitinophagaceae bacterium]